MFMILNSILRLATRRIVRHLHRFNSKNIYIDWCDLNWFCLILVRYGRNISHQFLVVVSNFWFSKYLSNNKTIILKHFVENCSLLVYGFDECNLVLVRRRYFIFDLFVGPTIPKVCRMIRPTLLTEFDIINCYKKSS